MDKNQFKLQLKN